MTEPTQVPEAPITPRPTRPRRRGPGVAPLDYFLDHKVFTLAEYMASTGRTDAAAASAQLGHHVRAGNLFRIKRGLYQYADDFDATAVAARWAPDAVLAYDSAFLIHSDPRRPLFTAHASLITASRCPGTDSITVVHRPTVEAITCTWDQTPVRVTPPEQTLVDLLDRPDLAPSGEDLWRYLALHRLNTDVMISHARALGSQVVQARLGAMIENLPWRGSLELLERPRWLAWFDRKRRRAGCTWHPVWNLMIPLRLMQLAHGTDFSRSPPRFPPDDELAP